MDIRKWFGIKKKAAPFYNGPAFRLIGGQIVLYKDNKVQYIEKGYSYNDIVFSIIQIILNKAKIAPWAPYTIKDEKAYSQLLSFRKELHVPGKYKIAKELSRKALEEYTSDGRLNELVKYPNENQTFSDLNESLFGYKLATGDYYEHWITANSGLNRGKPLVLSALPSQYMEIKGSRTFPIMEDGYRLQLGQIVDFSKEEVLHEKYWNPEWDLYGTQLYGMSPLKAALRRIQRNNEAQVASLSAFKNMGPPHIITPDTDNMDILSQMTWEQMGAMKERVDHEFNSGANNANKTAYVNAPLKVQDLGLSPVDLAILESEQFDLRMLCNVFGVPSQLLNDPENKSYNNSKEGEKALTARCAIPLLNSRRDSLNRKLQTLEAYKGKNIILDYDQTVYTELEEDRKEQAEWMSKSPHLTLRMRYQIQGLEIPPGIPDAVLDTVFLPNSWTPAQDLLVQPEDLSGDLDRLDSEGLKDYL